MREQLDNLTNFASEWAIAIFERATCRSLPRRPRRLRRRRVPAAPAGRVLCGPSTLGRYS